MQNLFLPVFVLLAVCCVTGLVTMQIFFSRLHRNYEAEWIQLGRPVVFLNSGMLNSFALMRYLWRKDYAKLSDAGINRLGNFLRSLIIFYLALFALVLVVTVFGITSKR